VTTLLWLILLVFAVVAAVHIAGGLLGLGTTLVIGALAGWLAGRYTRGRGFGLVKNVVIGIVGAVVGRILFGLLGFQSAGLIASLIMATVGAIVVLYCVRWLQSS
jgi:uncharacterized membrane protein YeaQ/YmgE (transglycosylase-associated protein family)